VETIDKRHSILASVSAIRSSISTVQKLAESLKKKIKQKSTSAEGRQAKGQSARPRRRDMIDEKRIGADCQESHEKRIRAN